MQSLSKANRLAVDVPDVYRPVFSDKRYIGCRGGRGAGRSWTVAIKLVATLTFFIESFYDYQGKVQNKLKTCL